MSDEIEHFELLVNIVLWLAPNLWMGPTIIYAIFFVSSIIVTYCEYWTHSDGGELRPFASALDICPSYHGGAVIVKGYKIDYTSDE
jgi:hypothetical protein